MKYYYLFSKYSNKFLDGRYMKSNWSDNPRLFRSVSGMRNATNLFFPEILNPAWFLEFTRENPSPGIHFDSNHRITREYQDWLRLMWKSWDEYRKKFKGMDFTSSNFEVKEIEIP